MIPPVDWIHYPLFIAAPEADALYALAADFPWLEKSADRAACYFGLPYGRGEQDPEIAIPESLAPLVARVAAVAKMPCNFVQVHRMLPGAVVLPHADPSKMVVPMLTLGQQRTFRVAGTMPNFAHRMRQSQRKLEYHHGFEDCSMGHGDLLVFNGGRVIHSMAPAADDENFHARGFEYRFSLLFRWTTAAMREFGPGDKARKAGHDKQYAAVKP